MIADRKVLVERGKRIRDARTAKKMKLKDLAKAVGVNLSTVCRWEHGVFAFSVDTYRKLCKVLESEI